MFENRHTTPVSVAAVIPAFDEEKTIGGVIAAVRAADLVGEIIVVDDGSKDGTAEAARRAGARVVSHARNLGKGSALETGVRAAEADILLFTDADLIGFTPEHVAALVTPVLEGRFDMVIGVIDRDYIGNVNRPLEARVSGMRALRREVWEKTPGGGKKGYVVDSAITETAEKLGVRIQTLTLAGLTHISKPKKRGLIRGILLWLAMWFEILSARGRGHD